MGHHYARDFAEADSDHGRVLDGAHLYGAIDSLGREVGRAIMQHPFDAHVRVARQIFAERGNQLVLAEGVRDLHPKRAARVVTRTEQLGFHLAPAFEDLPGETVAALTITGELHSVGRAIEQLQAE